MSSTPDKTNDTSQFAKPLLFGSAGAFAAGVFGAIWHTKRKQAKYEQREALALQQSPPAAQQKYVPPSMSPAEFELAKKDARFFAIKSLGYGTLLALTGAGVLATVVGYCLDVRNFREFSDKLHVIIPQRTARLRRYLGGKELEMTKAEEEELDALTQEIE